MKSFILHFGVKEFSINEIIFSHSYQEIKSPALAIKLLNFPFAILKGNETISYDKLRNSPIIDYSFKNAKTMHFLYSEEMERDLHTNDIVIKLVDLDGVKMRDIGTSILTLKDIENIMDRSSPIVIDSSFKNNTSYEIGKCKIYLKFELKETKEANLMEGQELKEQESNSDNRLSGNNVSNQSPHLKEADIKILKAKNTYFCPPAMFFQKKPAEKQKKEIQDIKYLEEPINKIPEYDIPSVNSIKIEKKISDYSSIAKESRNPNPIEVTKPLVLENNSFILDKLISELIQIREMKKGSKLPSKSPIQANPSVPKPGIRDPKLQLNISEKAINSPLKTEEEYNEEFESLKTSKINNESSNMTSNEKFNPLRKSDNSIVESIISLSQSQYTKQIQCFRCGLSFDTALANEHRKKCPANFSTRHEPKKSSRGNNDDKGIQSIVEEDGDLNAQDNSSSLKESRRRATNNSNVMIDSKSQYTEDFDDFDESYN